MIRNYYTFLIILTLTIKMEAIKKRVNARFFHEKSERLKKLFFYKSPPNGHFLFARYSFPNGNKK